MHAKEVNAEHKILAFKVGKNINTLPTVWKSLTEESAVRSGFLLLNFFTRSPMVSSRSPSCCCICASFQAKASDSYPMELWPILSHTVRLRPLRVFSNASECLKPSRCESSCSDQLQQAHRQSVGQDGAWDLPRHRRCLVCEQCLDDSRRCPDHWPADESDRAIAIAKKPEDWFGFPFQLGTLVRSTHLDLMRSVADSDSDENSVIACTVVRMVSLGPSISQKDSTCEFSAPFPTPRISSSGDAPSPVNPSPTLMQVVLQHACDLSRFGKQ